MISSTLKLPSRKGRLISTLLVALLLSGCKTPEEKAQGFYDHAQQLFEQHNLKPAEIEYKNAIGSKKDFLPAYRGLAKADEEDHAWSELAAVLRGIIELDPKDADSRIKLARLLFRGNAADEAQKVIADIDASNNADLLALKGAIAYKLKDPAAAVADANAALRINPANVDALMLLAADRLQNRDPISALAYVNKIPADRADDVAVQVFKIRIFDAQQDTAKVEAQLKKLAAQYPKEISLQQQLVRFYLSQNKPQDAEKILRSINQTPEAELELVRLLFVTQGPAAARAELDSRIGQGGDIFPYQMALADLEYNQHEFEASSNLLKQLASDNGSKDHAIAAKTKLAQHELEQKNVDQAEKLVAEILSADNRNAGGLKLRATIELNRDQFDPAINDIRTALNDQPRAPDLLMLMATAYERSGAIELAEKQLADALRASNYDSNVALAYSSFLQRRGNPQRAEDMLTDMAARKPRDVQILAALAEVKLGRQDWAGAQELGERIRQLGIANNVADQILGVAFGGENKVDQSVAAFQDALTAAPSATQPMISLVRELVQAKQSDKAVDFLQKTLKKEPDNADALVLLGSVQLANQQSDQAAKSFQTAISKKPKDNHGYRALADLYRSQHDKAAAIRTIQSGLEQLPDDLTLRMSLAALYEDDGNYDEAVKAYEYILSQQPGSLIAANNLASLLADHRSDKASLDRAQALAKSLTQSPIPQFKDTVGWVSYRAGDYKTAIPLLEQAVSALPNAAVIHYHLGMAYLGAGQGPKAVNEFRIALTKNPSTDLATNINAELKKTSTE